MRLAKVCGKERFETVSARALSLRARSYRRLKNILKCGLDRISLHESRRGKHHYRDDPAAGSPPYETSPRRLESDGTIVPVRETEGLSVASTRNSPVASRK